MSWIEVGGLLGGRQGPPEVSLMLEKVAKLIVITRNVRAERCRLFQCSNRFRRPTELPFCMSK